MGESPARVLIDMSNLRGGGGVQVAASFLDETSWALQDPEVIGCHPWIASATIVCDTLVAASVGPAARGLENLVIDEPRPWSWRRWRPTPHRHAVSFQLFGPEYASRRAPRRIVGYADGRSVFGPPRGEKPTLRIAIRQRVRVPSPKNSCGAPTSSWSRARRFVTCWFVAGSPTGRISVSSATPTTACSTSPSGGNRWTWSAPMHRTPCWRTWLARTPTRTINCSPLCARRL